MRCCCEALETMSQVAYRTRPTSCVVWPSRSLLSQHSTCTKTAFSESKHAHRMDYPNGHQDQGRGQNKVKPEHSTAQHSTAQHSTAQHTCASIFSSFHAVLGSTCAAAAGPCACWLASAGGSCRAGPRGAAGAATAAAAVGDGCSLAFSARSCACQNRTKCQ